MDRNKITREIVRLFAEGDYPEETKLKIWAWMVGSADPGLRDEALAGVWNAPVREGAADTERALRSVNRMLGMAGRERKRPALRIVFRVAAVLIPAMVLGGILLTTQKGTEQAETIAQYRRIEVVADTARTVVDMEDGSKVWLNAETRLESDNVREVYISGEAYCNVEKSEGERFIVKTDLLKATVLGTIFNIRAYPEAQTTIVTLYEGRLHVEAQGVDVILEHGHELVYDHELHTAEIVAVSASKPAWMRTTLSFDSVALAEVLAGLENHYRVEIAVPDLPFMRERVTLKLDEETTLERAMLILSRTSGKFSWRRTEREGIIVEAKY